MQYVNDIVKEVNERKYSTISDDIGVISNISTLSDISDNVRNENVAKDARAENGNEQTEGNPLKSATMSSDLFNKNLKSEDICTAWS